MSWMEKGFWIAAGGIAGFVAGGLLFDDDIGSSRSSRRLETSEADAGEDTATADRFAASTNNASESDDVKAAMDKLSASLDETLEALKPKMAEPEEA